MTIPTVINRYGATVGGQFYKTAVLLRHWVCADCGGELVHSIEYDRERRSIDDVIKCARCGGHDISREETHDAEE